MLVWRLIEMKQTYMFQTINLESRLATPAFPQAAVLWDHLERMSGPEQDVACRLDGGRSFAC